uniref:Ceramidase n=1 Tax=Panagrolaimus sp. JU765 TaxID=591449 RepID=A0AC34PW57_9BILA
MWITRFILFVVFLNFLDAFDERYRIPQRYAIDLDTRPEDRWNQVIDDHLDAIPLLLEEAKSYIPVYLQKPLFWIAEKLSAVFPEEYVREMRGIANRSGLAFGEVVGLNILYDITSFNHRIFSPFACTSIVAEDSKGRIYHGRNLDYEMGSLLRNTTILVDFIKDNSTVFTTTTFVLYVGVLTGQKPNAYAISLNARYDGAYIDNIFMELVTLFRNPVSFDIRKTLETKDNYWSAIEHLSQVHFVAPSYLIISGVKTGQGVIITRNRWAAADIFELNISKGRWFLVETNFDHWKKPGDDRRESAIRFLTGLKRGFLNDNTLLVRVLGKSPVNNNLTIFSSVMSAANPKIIYDATRIWLK